ncbi:MAG: hypothetical protein IPO83_03865 [Chitinophagaceae bacterium]|nr:hypothetical protein [Chitinophagaceae bacterium]
MKITEMQFPVIIKPNFEGGSDGIFLKNIVNSHTQLQRIIRQLFLKQYDSVVVESFIMGKEVTVAIVGNGADLCVYHPREVVFPLEKQTQGLSILSQPIKNNKKLRDKLKLYSMPLNEDRATVLKVKKIAARVFRILKLRIMQE